ncbi:MAG TPA: glycoside hydrolase family 99-like domain-containing protein, partial [Puia sp.]|nr:glycoside hydrolase family 99-like domain-containing protein [Puia sp.]
MHKVKPTSMYRDLYKKYFFIFLFALANIMAQAQSPAKKKFEVAVYYFPDYHVDPINEKWHGKDWTEWELVKAAKPRFNGHHQPKIPAWGYFNEADPKWAAKEIDLAADNGIDVFIYDWYWYGSTGPYLKDGLEKGFLKAPNND